MADLLGQPQLLVVRESSPDPELLRALGRLARGLSALFWGLPFALVVCLHAAIGVQTAIGGGPMLVRDGALRELESNGVPFGVVAGFPYSTATVELAPGEVFALFTDGIPEAQRGEELYDDARVRAAVAEEYGATDLFTMRGRLLTRVDEFLAGSPRTDDITLVLIRRAASAS